MMMKRIVFPAIALLLCFAAAPAKAQDFRVQISAYSQLQPDSFFTGRGVMDYTVSPDGSGIFWYSAGIFANWEEAEEVRSDLVKKGFPYAYIIDEEEQRALSNDGCPRIRDGVVFMKAPFIDSTTFTIYFDEGAKGLSTESRNTLDNLFLRIKQRPKAMLRIKGYTDGVGDGQANMQVAAFRSRSARDYLIEKGLRADRMIMEVYGEADPAAPNSEDDGSNNGKGRDLPENRKLNRRVTLTIEAAPLKPVESPK